MTEGLASVIGSQTQKASAGNAFNFANRRNACAGLGKRRIDVSPSSKPRVSRFVDFSGPPPKVSIFRRLLEKIFSHYRARMAREKQSFNFTFDRLLDRMEIFLAAENALLTPEDFHEFDGLFDEVRKFIPDEGNTKAEVLTSREYQRLLSVALARRMQALEGDEKEKYREKLDSLASKLFGCSPNHVNNGYVEYEIGGFLSPQGPSNASSLNGFRRAVLCKFVDVDVNLNQLDDSQLKQVLDELSNGGMEDHIKRLEEGVKYKEVAEQLRLLIERTRTERAAREIKREVSACKGERIEKICKFAEVVTRQMNLEREDSDHFEKAVLSELHGKYHESWTLILNRIPSKHVLQLGVRDKETNPESEFSRFCTKNIEGRISNFRTDVEMLGVSYMSNASRFDTIYRSYRDMEQLLDSHQNHGVEGLLKEFREKIAVISTKNLSEWDLEDSRTDLVLLRDMFIRIVPNYQTCRAMAQIDEALKSRSWKCYFGKAASIPEFLENITHHLKLEEVVERFQQYGLSVESEALNISDVVRDHLVKSARRQNFRNVGALVTIHSANVE